jgi:stearoyl-CoA desaturase (delta-9 desaturase)
MSLVWMAVITVALVQVSLFFTTIFVHRCVTHRGLDLHPVVRSIMHLHVRVFCGLSPRDWAAVHRKHHHFADKEGDPHSPYIYGLWHVFFGNYFYYRRERRDLAMVLKYTPDYRRDWIDGIPLIRYGVYSGLAIFMLLFGWLWGAVAWVLHMVLYVFLNAMINSLCHMIGYRNFDNKATNLQWVALMTAGEGLHNNHHEYPSSALFALRGWEFDPAWLLIRLLEVARLARVRPEPIAKAA